MTRRSEYIYETLQNRHKTNELRGSLKSKRATGGRPEAAGADTVDHYGNLKESNRLGDRRLGVLLECQHHGHGAVERAAAFAHQDATPTGQGIEQSYGSAVGNAYLRYMWHDSVMQAALRFGRDPEVDETVVVAHTAARHRTDTAVVSVSSAAAARGTAFFQRCYVAGQH